MNYLAHAWLSFDQPGILEGNMISDFVKGKKKFDFSPAIQKGIALHRAIDDFTDFHPVTYNAKSYFRKEYRLYSGAFVDIVYDHFLANDARQFADHTELEIFAQATYAALQSSGPELPVKFLQMLPYMRKQNWLYHYRLKEGIERSFEGLVRRAAYLSESAPAFGIFYVHYNELGECYRLFFPELRAFSIRYLEGLNDT